MEEQNIDMKFIEDSSNVETLCIFHFLDPYLSGFQLQDSFLCLIYLRCLIFVLS